MSTTPEVAAGHQVGRYELVERIGVGGMGEVWAARDPMLDRRVALKFVRGDRAGPRTRARLEREAQALAKVNHPNVVAVHEIGVDGDRVYIAQELVVGADVARWLTAASRTWREVVAVFAQAGRGLAAANAAGIVHRDFKPSNVLVGDDGRVRVVDFGIAYAHHEADSEPASVPSALALTETGAITGTPLYMSPEQHLGQPPTALSDQFSFCVSLYEALYGTLPFSGENSLDYALEAVRGNVTDTPDRGVPRWLRELLLRGLRAGGHEPLAAMTDVVAALERDRGRTRRWGWAIAAGAVVAGAAAMLAYTAAHDDTAECSGAVDQVATVWSAHVKDQARAAFAASALPYATDSWHGAEVALDGYAREWAAMHTDACRATRVRREQSEAALDLRMSCLARRLQELGAAAEQLAQADAQTVEKSAAVASGVTPLAECADVEALRAITSPPRDPAVIARVRDVRELVARAGALGRAGKLHEAVAVAAGAAIAARTTGYDPVIAEALLELGDAHDAVRADADTGDELRAAFTAALAGGDSVIGAKVAAALAHHAAELDHPADGLWWGDLARAELKRRPDAATESYVASNIADVLFRDAQWDAARAEYERALAASPTPDAGDHGGLGSVLLEQGKYAQAVAELRKALAIRIAQSGPDHPATAEMHSRLASALGMQGHYPEAIAEERAAVVVLERVFGPNNPKVADARFNLGSTLLASGDPKAAVEELTHAVQADEVALGPDHLSTAEAHNELGSALEQLGRHADALPEHQRALAIEQAQLAPDHPSLAATYADLGIVLEKLNRFDEAIAAYRHAIAIQERTVGAGHPNVGRNHANIANALADEGKITEALAESRTAFAILSEALGPEHPDLGLAHGQLADLLGESGDLAGAFREYTLAIELRARAVGANDLGLASLRTNLGINLVELGREREAIAPLEQAIASDDAIFGAHSAQSANVRAELGQAYLKLRDFARAADQLARAAADLAPSHDAQLHARISFGLAKALWERDDDRARAHQLAVDARGELAPVYASDHDPSDGKVLDELRVWLASH